MEIDEIRKLQQECITWNDTNNLWYHFVAYLRKTSSNEAFVHTADYAYNKDTRTYQQDFLKVLSDVNTKPRAERMLDEFLLWRLTR